jgi:hypothetical protein
MVARCQSEITVFLDEIMGEFLENCKQKKITYMIEMIDIELLRNIDFEMMLTCFSEKEYIDTIDDLMDDQTNKLFSRFCKNDVHIFHCLLLQIYRDTKVFFDI